MKAHHIGRRAFCGRLAGLGAAVALGAASGQAPAVASRRRVCLVSGANESKPYSTDRTLAELGEFLTTARGADCSLLTANEAGTSFRNIERLETCDAAIFFVRRKTPDAPTLATLRRFFSSGKGFIALRATSHAWENWPDFDQEVLGAKYGGAKGGNFGNVERLHYRPHPIWTGAEDFDTRCDIYRYGPVAADVNVILEGENQNGRMPVAWTRVHRDARLFHLALGYAYDMEKPAFRRIVANGLDWVCGG
jgi:type 1 glutamine amidotransferase